MIWQPTMAEMVSGFLAVLTDSPPPISTNALFIHGSQGDPQLDAKELNAALAIYRKYHTDKIVLNGLTTEECRELNLAYCGYEKWGKFFLDCSIPEEDIILLPPSKHTGAESENLLLLARDRGWKSVTIMAYPYHLLRCFLQIVAAMKKLKIHLRVYAKTFGLDGDDWRRQTTRSVMGGANVLGDRTMNGRMVDHIASELDRVVGYAQESENFTRHATISELLQYLTERSCL